MVVVVVVVNVVVVVVTVVVMEVTVVVVVAVVVVVVVAMAAVVGAPVESRRLLLGLLPANSHTRSATPGTMRCRSSKIVVTHAFALTLAAKL